MKRKFGCHSRSFFASSIAPIYNDVRPFLSAITIITVALLVFLPSPSSLFSFNVNANDFVAFASLSSTSQLEDTTTVTAPPSPPPSPPPLMPQSTLISHSQPSQSQSQENADPTTDNFDLPAGYIIEPFMSNLSMPTSIAIDSSNRTVYVAESITEYENNNNNSSSSIALASSPSSSSSVSFISEQSPPPLLELQVRIVKANISGSSNNDVIPDQSSDTNSSGGINDDNNTTIVVENVLNWPVIDMEVDDTSGLLYAFHDPTTIWRINTTSGEREDILVTEEEEEQETAIGVSANGYEEELQDPLSVLINSSSQIVLSGKQENYDNMDGEQEEEQEQTGNYDSHHSTVLYIPCINGDIDDYDKYCILSLPIDRNGYSAIVENISGANSLPQILENMTSRPIGIAILNSSYVVASSPSNISEQQVQRPYALISSETSSYSLGNNNNYTELLVIGSQPTNNNSISALSTIYHVKVSDSIPYLGVASNNNNNNNNTGSNSNQNPQLQQALPTASVESLVGYPDGHLGKVALVSVPPVTSSSSSVNDNESSETNLVASSEEDDQDTISSSPPFGLNKTTAFIIDYGNNSSASSAALPLQLPKIIMLDVETGSVTPFLTLNSPDPNFMPIDIAFDYYNRALYVLSSSSNQEEDTDITYDTPSSNNLLNTDTHSNNSGLIWKISYQGPEEEAETNSNSSSISDGTDNGNNATSDLTTPPPPLSSSNDTDSSSNSSDSDSDLDDSYDEDPDETDDGSIDTDDGSIDTDDGSIDTDDGSIDTDDGSIDTDDGNSGSSNEDTDDDNGDGGGNSSPPETSPPSSPPSTEPVNNPPIAQADVATTDQDMPVVIDVLANDVDSDGDPLIIISVDEESIQGGNVRIISGGDTNDEDSAIERIEYTPAEGFIGSDEFTYTISDSNGAIDSATVTIIVNQVVIAPHPISYWLENENGITQGLLERMAEEPDSDSDNEEQEEWSFNLGNFRVPVEFDVSDNENDTRGILEAGQGSNNDDEEEDDNSANVYDQLAAQLLAAKLNIENGVSTCEPIVTTIGYADTVLRDALYNGPGSTENPTDESSRDYAFELIEILDTYNNNGCI